LLTQRGEGGGVGGSCFRRSRLLPAYVVHTTKPLEPTLDCFQLTLFIPPSHWNLP